MSGRGTPADGSGDHAAFTGLPMSSPPDPAELERERAWLVELEHRGVVARSLKYLKRGGPGYLQSALTLGGGTATASLFAGAAFGYQLLWVAPVAMLLGVVMLAAVAHQTLSTGQRPFPAMRRHAGPVFAYGWAFGALFASIIWHFPHYALSSAVLTDLADHAGIHVPYAATGLIVLAFAVAFAFMYGASPRWIRAFERLLKYMVWSIVLCFGLVVFETGVKNVGDLARGFFAFQIPADRNGVAGLTVVISGLAAAVGVNMVFLYPYSLLARGWGREHRRLARFDLLFGMFLPYTLATSLMVIATANTFHYGDVPFTGTALSPVEAAETLAAVAGPTVGRAVFDLGILGMAWSSITLHMLCCGFVCSELFGLRVGGFGYRLACLLPTPGVLGAFLWEDMKLWLAVPTTVLCGFLLPLAYIGFIRLQTSRAYLGADRPAGARGVAWLGGMVFATLTLVVFLVWYVVTKGTAWFAAFE